MCHLFYGKYSFAYYGWCLKYKYKILKVLLLRNWSYAFLSQFNHQYTFSHENHLFNKIQQLTLKLVTDYKSLSLTSFFLLLFFIYLIFIVFFPLPFSPLIPPPPSNHHPVVRVCESFSLFCLIPPPPTLCSDGCQPALHLWVCLHFAC